MPTYRAQVVIPMFSGLPKDVMTNTFHFDPLPGGTLPLGAAAITPVLKAYYESLYINTRPMGSYMDPELAFVNWYNLEDPEPRAPLRVNMPLTASVGSTEIPTEAAMVVSFQGDVTSGGVRSRRRGRIYLGALGTGWIQPSAAAIFPRLSASSVAVLVARTKVMAEAADAAGYQWSVWSPTDQQSTLVTNGWVDDAIDTQRRRGVDSTLRTAWTAEYP